MSIEHAPVSLPAAALLAGRRMASAGVALAAVVVAGLVLDGVALTIVVVAIFLVLIASYVRRDSAREDPERPRDPFDAVSERKHTAEQYVPLMLAIGLFVVLDLETIEFAAAALALFFVSTTALVWRCNRRPSAPRH
jgi:hypothetical protein